MPLRPGLLFRSTVVLLGLLSSAVWGRGQQVSAAGTGAAGGTDSFAAISPPPVASGHNSRDPTEISPFTMISYGNYRVFGAAARCNAYTAGVEFDRNSWGHHLKARIDYVMEVQPLVLFSEPAVADFWGNPKSPNQQMLHGIGFSPFGFRFIWREGTRIKPYMTGRAGGVVFNKKAMSNNASYANFNFQGEFGLQFPLTDRVELRLAPLAYYHVSNGYLAASNPGMDELAIKFAMSYVLGRGRAR